MTLLPFNIYKVWTNERVEPPVPALLRGRGQNISGGGDYTNYLDIVHVVHMSIIFKNWNKIDLEK